jgi:hypothetical protein
VLRGLVKGGIEDVAFLAVGIVASVEGENEQKTRDKSLEPVKNFFHLTNKS